MRGELIMRQASLVDLKKELWLRQRNSGQIVWETRDGKFIPIKDMTYTHLINALNMLARHREAMEHIGECDSMDWYD